VISPREELYTNRPVDGVIMRDWLASAFSAPDAIEDQVEEGTLATVIPDVLPFDCPVAPEQPVEKGGQSLSTAGICRGICGAERDCPPFSTGW
jgi:hypothetical protein